MCRHFQVDHEKIQINVSKLVGHVIEKTTFFLDNIREDGFVIQDQDDKHILCVGKIPEIAIYEKVRAYGQQLKLLQNADNFDCIYRIDSIETYRKTSNEIAEKLGFYKHGY